MRTAVVAFLAVGVCFALCCAGFVCAQENDDAASQAGMSAPAEWLWGEVVSVDQSAGTLTVRYLDYDTDMEKETVVSTDASTVFENIESLAGIKAEDTVSIDFMASGDKKLAKLISVERIEDESMFPPEGQEAAPEKVGSEPVAGSTVP